MRLSDKQALFTSALWRLLEYAETNHTVKGVRYRTRIRDVYRPPNATYGHPKSTHKSGLAADIIIDRLLSDGKWEWVRTNCPFYEMLGAHWLVLGEDIGLDTRWGGVFHDYNHFSVYHEGVL